MLCLKSNIKIIKILQINLHCFALSRTDDTDYTDFGLSGDIFVISCIYYCRAIPLFYLTPSIFNSQI